MEEVRCGGVDGNGSESGKVSSDLLRDDGP